MTKAEIIADIAASHDLPKTVAARIVDDILNAVMRGAKSPDGCTFAGFGRFSVTEHAARSGRNPRTGETIQIAARRAVKFSPAKQFRDFVMG